MFRFLRSERGARKGLETEAPLPRVRLEGPEGDLGTFPIGAFLGGVDAVSAAAETGTRASVGEGGNANRIARADLRRLFERDPGLRLALFGTRSVI